MTAEGIGPKIDGDVLYASEINKCSVAPVIAGLIEYNGFIGSSTIGTPVGSIIIPPGSMSSSSYILGEVMQTEAVTSALRFRFSGTDFGQNFEAGSYQIPDEPSAVSVHGIFSSNTASYLKSYFINLTTGEEGAAKMLGYTTGAYPSSGVVVLINSLHAESGSVAISGTAYVSYSKSTAF